MNTEAEEARKYAAIWQHPDYANFSPGEQFVDLFLELAQPDAGNTVADLGAGTGRADLALVDSGLLVTAVDLVDAREEKGKTCFRRASIWSGAWFDPGHPFHYGYCTDVLEHIPTEYVMLTLHRISEGVERCFFSISSVPDHFGQKIGEPLHLTVKPFLWWKQRIEESGGKILHARDLLIDSIFWVDYG